MITIDKNWSIVGEKYQWELRQEVEKTRNKKGGGEEKYIDTVSWYHHDLKWLLNKYVEEVARPSKTVGELLEKLDYVTKIIENLDERK